MPTDRGAQRKGDNKHKGVIGLWVLSLLLTLVSLSSTGSVWAQTPPSLAVSPAEGKLYLDGVNTIVLELVMADVVDMQSVDIIVTFDPAVVQLDSFNKGSFLNAFSQLYLEQTSGYLRITFVKAGAPAVSGSGVILQLTFSGLYPGISEIDVSQTIYAKPTGVKVYPTVENGSLDVGYIAYDVTGTVRMQGRSVTSGVAMTMTAVSHPEYGAFTETSLDLLSFNIYFEALRTATYRVTTLQPRYLNVVAGLNKQISLVADVTMPPLNLVAGNAVWTNNVIDINDVTLVTGWYGKTEADLGPGETLDADVNFDGRVDMRDLALVAGNYNRTSASAYAGWVP